MRTVAHRRRNSRRGYSLVEIMIVLAAGALLAAGPLLLVHNKTLQDNYDSARRQLEIAAQAVVDYAAVRRTVARPASVNGGRDVWLPDGRPYLPCPDRDGDGYEDRVGSLIPAAVTVSVMRDGEVVGRPGQVAGECAVSMGWLPHATLGLPQADPWGNLLVYRVDLVLSNPLVGLDGSSRANSYDLASPLRLADDGAGGSRLELPPLSERAGSARARGFFQPPMVCVGRPSVAGDDACGFGTLIGDVAAVGETLTVTGPFDGMESYYTRAAAADFSRALADVPAFVVYSSGRELTGPLVTRSAVLEEDVSRLCRVRQPITSASFGDRHNYDMLFESLCNGRGESSIVYTPGRAQAAGEISGRRGLQRGWRADDQAAWRTAGEIAAELERVGALPARAFPPLAPEEVAAHDLNARVPVAVDVPMFPVYAEPGSPGRINLVLSRPLDPGETPVTTTIETPAGVTVSTLGGGYVCAPADSPCDIAVSGPVSLTVSVDTAGTFTVTVDNVMLLVRPRPTGLLEAGFDGPLAYTAGAGTDVTIPVTLTRPVAPGETPPVLTLDLPVGNYVVTAPDGSVCPPGPATCEVVLDADGDLVVTKNDNLPLTLDAGAGGTVVILPPPLGISVPLTGVVVPVSVDTEIPLTLTRPAEDGETLTVTVDLPPGDYTLVESGRTGACPAAPPGQCSIVVDNVSHPTGEVTLSVFKRDNLPVSVTVNGDVLVLARAPTVVAVDGLDVSAATLTVGDTETTVGVVTVTLQPGFIPGVDQVEFTVSVGGGGSWGDGLRFGVPPGSSILGVCGADAASLGSALGSGGTCRVTVPSSVAGSTWVVTLFNSVEAIADGTTVTFGIGGEDLTVESVPLPPLQVVVPVAPLQIAAGGNERFVARFNRPPRPGEGGITPSLSVTIPAGSDVTVRSIGVCPPTCQLGRIANTGRDVTVIRGSSAPPTVTITIAGQPVTVVAPRPVVDPPADGGSYWFTSADVAGGTTVSLLSLSTDIPVPPGETPPVITVTFDATEIGLSHSGGACSSSPCEVQAGDLSVTIGSGGPHLVTIGSSTVTVGHTATTNPPSDVGASPSRFTIPVNTPTSVAVTLTIPSGARPGVDFFFVSVETGSTRWGSIFDSAADFRVSEGADGPSFLKDHCNLDERGSTAAQIRGNLQDADSCRIPIPGGQDAETWVIDDLFGLIEFLTPGQTVIIFLGVGNQIILESS